MSFVVNLLSATVTATSPLLLATLGEIISERSGVINLGIEGMMLVGAFSGFVVTVVTGNPYLGLVTGTILGVIFSTIHAFLSISLNADQVVSGIMITLLGTGITAYLGADWTTESIEGFRSIPIPILVDIPVIGEALFMNPVTDYLSVLLVPVVWYFLFRTNLGLEINAVGEDPKAADTAGVNVRATRYLCVLIGGGFAGAAGAVLSLSVSNLWVPGMVAGRGWIAVALVIFAQWGPVRALFGSYLFGAIDAFAVRSQGLNLNQYFGEGSIINEVLLNGSILQTYPYIATIVVLIYISIKATNQEIGAPSSLLKSYSRESE
jgi:simple sugar transport system permease protein